MGDKYAGETKRTVLVQTLHQKGREGNQISQQDCSSVQWASEHAWCRVYISEQKRAGGRVKLTLHGSSDSIKNIAANAASWHEGDGNPFPLEG